MKFELLSEGLEYAEPMFERIAGAYREMLCGRFLWDAKLNVLEVTADRHPDLSACGEFRTTPEMDTFSITLHLEEDEVISAYVMAHELAHLLMSNINISRFQEAHDRSVPLNSHVHRMGEDGGDFGFGLEETIADALGWEIVRRVYGPEFVDKGKWGKPDLDECALRSLADCFGSPLEELAQLDQTESIGKKVHFRTPYSPCDETEVIPAGQEWGNGFWLLLATQSFPDLMRRYDDCMGIGAFRRLCGMFDAYCGYVRGGDMPSDEERLLTSMFPDDAVPKRCVELYEAMNAEIERFRVLYGEADEEWTERKTVEDSLKETAERLSVRCRMFVQAYRGETERHRRILEHTDGLPPIIEANERQLLSAYEENAAGMEAVGRLADMLGKEDPASALRRADEHVGAAADSLPETVDPEGHLEAIRGMLASAMEVIGYYADAANEDAKSTQSRLL